MVMAIGSYRPSATPRRKRTLSDVGATQSDDDSFDIVTPTERERREVAIAQRRRRYFMVMIPCIALVIFGFFVPAPTPIRLIALGLAAVMPPLASIIANPPCRR